MVLRNTSIFLAGATGLAGSSIISYISENYPDISIKGSYWSTKPYLEGPCVSYVQADLTNRTDCSRAVRGCELAIMAAASTGGAGAASLEPHRQVTDNLIIDALMLEALHVAGIKRVIYLSSATVYQEFKGYIKEDELDFNQDPHQAYVGVGWAKRSAEKLCWFWQEKYGMEIIIVRCANIYGPYSRFDPGNSNFIPAIIRKSVERTDPFDVWGDPDVRRDVIYTQDFAEAVMALLAHEEIKYGVYNLGFGETVTVGEVVDLALRHSEHRPASIIYDANRPATIGFRALDCRKIKNVLKWEPHFPIDEGVRRTTIWWSENEHWWRK